MTDPLTDEQLPPRNGPFACPWCRGPVDVKSRHVAVAGSAVRIYCSGDCLQAFLSGAVNEPAPQVEPEEPTPMWPRVVGISIGLGALVFLNGPAIEVVEVPPVVSVASMPEIPMSMAPPSPDLLAEEARREAERALEAALVADLAKDAWFHPLSGPERRMPKNHVQAFGAERPGDRPVECVSGHCGVDLGGGLWGEPVRAAHAGIVDRVNRGPNEEHGGVYVRLAHREGTVFTWYFHLAAVPRWINAGTPVEAGDLIGLIGDTGIKSSAAHLHFAISVKPAPGAQERYLDPESLIAIWPLWIPGENGSGIPRVSVHGAPGLPMRTRRPRKARKPAPALPEPVLSGEPVAAEGSSPAPAAPAAP
jgi:murein DD-endopeptidase MepM/ murein hydrolase activator NlpD